VCADPRAEALALAAEIASKNPDAIRAAKRLLNAPDLRCRSRPHRGNREQIALIGSPNQSSGDGQPSEARAGVHRERRVSRAGRACFRL